MLSFALFAVLSPESSHATVDPPLCSVSKTYGGLISGVPNKLGGVGCHGDGITYDVTTPPTHGVANEVNAAESSLTYTPDLDFLGTDSLVLHAVNDGGSGSTVIYMEVTIRGPTIIPFPPNVKPKCKRHKKAATKILPKRCRKKHRK